MFTIRPQRALSMSSSARRMQWKAPLRFVSITDSHWSAFMRIASPSWRSPALLTSTSTGPYRSRTCAKALSTEAGSPTSACTSPLVRPSVTTVSPSSPSRCAIALPIPRPPPVTSATPPSGTGMDALLPLHDARAPHEAAAERGERDGVAGLEVTALLGVVQRERDRRARRVGDRVDVGEDLLLGHLQAPRGGVDDALVGLVDDEHVDVVDGHPGAAQRLGRRLDHPLDGVAVDLLALHPQQPLLAPGVEQVAVLAVGGQHERRAAVREVAGLHDDGRGAVGEQDRGAAVVGIGDAAERLGPDDEGELRAPGLD